MGVFFRKEDKEKLLHVYPFNRMKELGGFFEKLPNAFLLSNLSTLLVDLIENKKREAVYAYWKRAKSSLRMKLRTVLSLKPIIYWKPDIIHIDDSYLGLFLWQELLLLNVPIVISLRGGDVDEKPYKLARWKEWYISAGKEENVFFHCVSQYIQKKAEEHGVARRQCRVIYAGFEKTLLNFSDTEAEDFSLPRKSKIRLITVSRLSPEKGIDISLKAIRILVDQGLDVYYEIIGDGPQREELVNLIERLNLSDRVILQGQKENIFIINRLKFLSDKAIYIQPSLLEAFGFSMLEAASVAIPIIASNVGGIPEFIKNNENGLLFERANPQDLADKVIWLVNHPEQRLEFSKKIKNSVKNEFDSNVEADIFIQWYGEILAGQRT